MPIPSSDADASRNLPPSQVQSTGEAVSAEEARKVLVAKMYETVSDMFKEVTPSILSAEVVKVLLEESCEYAGLAFKNFRKFSLFFDIHKSKVERVREHLVGRKNTIEEVMKESENEQDEKLREELLVLDAFLRVVHNLASNNAEHWNCPEPTSTETYKVESKQLQEVKLMLSNKQREMDSKISGIVDEYLKEYNFPDKVNVKEQMEFHVLLVACKFSYESNGEKSRILGPSLLSVVKARNIVPKQPAVTTLPQNNPVVPNVPSQTPLNGYYVTRTYTFPCNPIVFNNFFVQPTQNYLLAPTSIQPTIIQPTPAVPNFFPGLPGSLTNTITQAQASKQAQPRTHASYAPYCIPSTSGSVPTRAPNQSQLIVPNNTSINAEATTHGDDNAGASTSTD